MSMFKNFYARVWAVKVAEAYGAKYYKELEQDSNFNSYLIAILKKATKTKALYLRPDMSLNLIVLKPTAMECFEGLFRMKVWLF